MKALWQDRLYVIVENHDSHVELQPVDEDIQPPLLVSYAASTLVIDPTDGDIEEAEARRQYRSRCDDCPHEDYITLSTRLREHECESCGQRFIDRKRTMRYFGVAAEKR